MMAHIAPHRKMNRFNIPILLIIYRRHVSLKAQVDILRSVRPSQVYVFADGPRNEAEAVDCSRARRVLEGIDWPCEVKKNFMESNLGCGRGPSTAMDWFFANVPEGIILEDDLLPHADFFQFCAELLERFRDDNRVMEISGTNRLGRWGNRTHSYIFSRWGSECGWATWQRAWRHFDYTIRRWASPQARRMAQNVLRHPMRVAFLSRILDQTHKDPASVSWWDYQWTFAKMLNNGLAAVPAANLVRNVGCDMVSNHDRDRTHVFAVKDNLTDLPFPLHHPLDICPDSAYDEALLREAITFRHCLSSLIPRAIKQHLKRLMPVTAERKP